MNPKQLLRQSTALLCILTGASTNLDLKVILFFLFSLILSRLIRGEGSAYIRGINPLLSSFSGLSRLPDEGQWEHHGTSEQHIGGID